MLQTYHKLKMSLSKTLCCYVLLLAVVCVASLQLISANDSLNADNNHGNPSETISENQTERQRFKLPKLIDFETYKQSFHRVYGSILEESERKRLFLARKLRASLSWIKYKLNLASYRYGINQFSDKSRRELDLMRNQQLDSMLKPLPASEDQHQDRDPLSAEALAGQNPDKLLQELDQLTAGQLSLDNLQATGTQQLKLIKLFGGIEQGVESALGYGNQGATTLIDHQIITINSNKKQAAELRRMVPETAKYWRAIVDQQPRPMFVSQQFKSKKGSTNGGGLWSGLYQHVWVPLAGFVRNNPLIARLSGDQNEKSDQVFLDLRQTTGCIASPLNQQSCGSCYAFAATTLAEFVYCKQTGSLVPFSQQYIIDCGKATGATGCKGGGFWKMMNFMEHFGMELAHIYPYVARDNECPYGPRVELKAMGRIRFKMSHSTVLNEDQFEAHLGLGPIWVAALLPGDFLEYEEGVIDGSQDELLDGAHAIVIVGHGRQNNQNYWLVKNSFGTQWGQGGYFKLLRKSTLIGPILEDAWQGQGLMFGRIDDHQLHIEAELNQFNNPRYLPMYMRLNRRI